MVKTDRLPGAEVPSGSTWRFTEENRFFNPQSYRELANDEISKPLQNVIDVVTDRVVRDSWSFATVLVRQSQFAFIYTNSLATRELDPSNSVPRFESLIKPDLRLPDDNAKIYNYWEINESVVNPLLAGTNYYADGLIARFNQYTTYKKGLFTEKVKPHSRIQTGVAGLVLSVSSYDDNIAGIQDEIDDLTRGHNSKVNELRAEIAGIQSKISPHPLPLFPAAQLNQ